MSFKEIYEGKVQGTIGLDKEFDKTKKEIDECIAKLNKWQKSGYGKKGEMNWGDLGDLGQIAKELKDITSSFK